VEIWHRIGYSHKDNAEEALQAIAVAYRKTDGSVLTGYILTLEITESDPKWPQVAELVHAKPGSDFVWTEFTSEEVLAAEWLMVAVARRIGEAEPQKDGGWERITLNEGCPECGVGATQKAPYRIRAEPRLGKRAFASLYNGWPLLCIPQVLGELKKAEIRGYEPWPVLLHRAGAPSQRIQQAFVTATASPPTLAERAAETEYFSSEVCPVCRQVRYTRYNRGMMPVRRSALRLDIDLQLTHEWFGSGRAAHQEILVSARVVRLIAERSWAGIVLWPVRLV
jgi:hypothetical protein